MTAARWRGLAADVDAKSPQLALAVAQGAADIGHIAMFPRLPRAIRLDLSRCNDRWKIVGVNAGLLALLAPPPLSFVGVEVERHDAVVEVPAEEAYGGARSPPSAWWTSATVHVCRQLFPSGFLLAMTGTIA